MHRQSNELGKKQKLEEGTVRILIASGISRALEFKKFKPIYSLRTVK
jgi:hypothetical protein